MTTFDLDKLEAEHPLLKAYHERLNAELHEAKMDAAQAHAEVGRHASFLLKLWDAHQKGGAGAVTHELAKVIIMHNGFPTVDFSRLP